jgi:hypothetical protein
LSERRCSAASTRRLWVTARAASGGGERCHGDRDATGGGHALEHGAGVDRGDDRIAHAVGDVGDRVVGGEPVRGGAEQRLGKERRGEEQDHEREGEDPLDERGVARPQRQDDADAGEARPGQAPDGQHEQEAGHPALHTGAEDQPERQEERRLRDRKGKRGEQAAQGDGRAGNGSGHETVEEPPFDLQRDGDARHHPSQQQ